MTGRGHKTPLAVAYATGRTEHDPARYEEREDPDVTLLGPASEHMTPGERAWFEHYRLHGSLWLVESDRAMVEIYARFADIIHQSAINPTYDNRGLPMLPLNDKEFNQFYKIATTLGFTPSTRQNVQIARKAKKAKDDLF